LKTTQYLSYCAQYLYPENNPVTFILCATLISGKQPSIFHIVRNAYIWKTTQYLSYCAQRLYLENNPVSLILCATLISGKQPSIFHIVHNAYIWKTTQYLSYCAQRLYLENNPVSLIITIIFTQILTQATSRETFCADSSDLKYYR